MHGIRYVYMVIINGPETLSWLIDLTNFNWWDWQGDTIRKTTDFSGSLTCI